LTLKVRLFGDRRNRTSAALAGRLADLGHCVDRRAVAPWRAICDRQKHAEQVPRRDAEPGHATQGRLQPRPPDLREPRFTKLVDDVLLELEKSGRAEKIFNAWFAPVKRRFTIKRD
jgi:hypothetical protein